MRRLILSFTLIITTLITYAQTGIHNFDVSQSAASSNPMYLTEYKGKLYFFADDVSTGRELFVVEGIQPAKLTDNVNPGNNNAISNNFNQPIAGLGSKVYFSGNNGSAGQELFSYDGNSVALVADLTFLTDPADSSNPDNFVVLNNKLYFTASSAVTGQEMYVYDTVSFPQRVTDINVGIDSSVFGPMVAYDNKIFFVGNTPAFGAELWYYDPQADTALLVADIDTGVASSNPANLTVLNGNLYFSANNLFFGRELYKYDGTNTTRLTDIAPSGLSSLTPVIGDNAFAWWSNKVYFGGRDSLGQRHVYSYDPANDNVSLAFKVNTNGSSEPRGFVVLNNKLYFNANDGVNGFELITISGSSIVTNDICAGSNSGLPRHLTVIGSELYFSGNDCTGKGTELLSFNEQRVSVESAETNNELSIFPNPAHTSVTIDGLKGTGVIEIHDIIGKVVYQQNAAEPPATTIDISNLACGTYIVHIIYTNNHRITGKFIKG